MIAVKTKSSADENETVHSWTGGGGEGERMRMSHNLEREYGTGKCIRDPKAGSSTENRKHVKGTR